MKILQFVWFAALAAAGCGSLPGPPSVPQADPPGLTPAFAPEAADFPSTFSIAAVDPEKGDAGVAVQSKFFGVGGVVPWTESNAGAIATQSYANMRYGPEGLALLREGKSAAEAVQALTSADPDRDRRQLGIVDARGGAANFTGKGCFPWAGARSGKNYTVQGNILVGPETVEAMGTAFEESAGEELAERLMRALEAGQRAGGDVRGRQSAAIYVSRKNGGYGGNNDRYIAYHVEDHADPIAELRRILDMRLGKDPASRAGRAAQGGDLAGARRILEEAAGRQPADAALLFRLAALELRAGDKPAAFSAIERALKTDPAYDNLYYQAAIFYFQAEDADKAMAMLKRLIEINPRYRPRLKLDLGTAGHAFFEHRRAIEDSKLLGD